MCCGSHVRIEGNETHVQVRKIRCAGDTDAIISIQIDFFGLYIFSQHRPQDAIQRKKQKFGFIKRVDKG